MTAFIRLMAERDKAASLQASCREFRAEKSDPNVYEVSVSSFSSVPGAPFAYWVSGQVRDIFSQISPFESNGRSVQHGASTKDDFRFIRIWWEVRVNGTDWTYFAKGGSYSRFYSDMYLAVNWRDNARELEAALLHKYPYLGDSANWVIHRECEYLRPGLTWPKRTTSDLSFRMMPSGCIFSDKGSAAFARTNNPNEILALCAIANSRPFGVLVSLQLAAADAAARSYEVGVIQKTPVPEFNEDVEARLAVLAKRHWYLMKYLDSTAEISHAFCLPSDLRSRIGEYPQFIQAELAEIQAEIDDIAFGLYGFSDSDRTAARGSVGLIEDDVREAIGDEDDSDDDDGAEAGDQTDGLLSWAAGVAFGRFDWRLATGEREVPPEPDPFDRLPAMSPGMLPDGAAPFHDHNGILVDDQGHPHDLPRLIEDVLARVDSEVRGDVRRWLQRDFFPLHLKQYSKSRRKAPIYWPLSTTSGRYTLWLYYPSLTSQTLYTAVNDFVESKLKQVGRDTAALRDKGTARSRDDEMVFEALQTLELELIELRDTLLAVAPTYRPNHDDGVQITAAPLWQLFRHKPWQKKLNDTWAKLEKGDYDWAHLAKAYWPDRVREKCKTDKSLAIAHGLEHIYVEPEPKAPKIRGRKKRGGA